MEKLVKIISQGAHSVRTYNGGNGEPMAFHYMDFELTDGIDTFHARSPQSAMSHLPSHI